MTPFIDTEVHRKLNKYRFQNHAQCVGNFAKVESKLKRSNLKSRKYSFECYDFNSCYAQFERLDWVRRKFKALHNAVEYQGPICVSQGT